jgi:hypothetical protein
VNLDDADALLQTIPGVRRELHVTRSSSFNRWSISGHVIAWERPLSKKDVAATGVAGEVLAVHVADVGEKSAWMLAAPQTCFDSPHFAGYPAVLINLQNADPQVLFEIAEATADRLAAS